MLVIDNFLSKEDFQWCLDKKQELFKDDGKIMWWNGSQSVPPRNNIERLIEKILVQYDAIGRNYDMDMSWVEGYEYWTNTLTKGETLKWHVNADEYERVHNNKDIIAPIGCVFYFSYSASSGGLLEISSKSLKNNDDLSGGYGDIEKIKPIPNRLVIFDPSYWHRVTDVRGDRCCLIFDLWDRKVTTSNKGYLNHYEFCDCEECAKEFEKNSMKKITKSDVIKWISDWSVSRKKIEDYKEKTYLINSKELLNLLSGWKEDHHESLEKYWRSFRYHDSLGTRRRNKDYYKKMMEEIKRDGWKKNSEPAKIMIIKYLEGGDNWSGGIGLHDGNHRMALTKLNNIECDIPLQIEGYRVMDTHKTNLHQNRSRKIFDRIQKLIPKDFE